MIDPLSLDATALVSAYRHKTVSPVETMTAVLEKAERIQPLLNPFLETHGDAAMDQARASEARWAKRAPIGLLDGVPFTVKDNQAWAGKPIRRGSRTTPTDPFPDNSPVVDRLIEAGAIPFTKTTMPEFAWKGVTNSPLTGLTRNPWRSDTDPGGSSGGAAVAAVLNLGHLHIATDGAGSIRIPASFCGLYGIKPSYGRVPTWPPSPFPILSHVGPVSRTVRDAALFLAVGARPDVRDMHTDLADAPDFRTTLGDGVRGLRLAWSPRLGYVRVVDAEVLEACRRAVTAFEEMGAVVEEVDPDVFDPTEMIETIWGAGVGVVLSKIPPDQHAAMDPHLVAFAQRGNAFTLDQHIAAVNRRNDLFTAYHRFHQRYDLLLTPTLAATAPPAGRNNHADGRFGDEGDWLGWTPYSYPFNLTGQPACSLPVGLSADGLPIGLQAVAARGRDDLVLRASKAFEAARPWAMLDEPIIVDGQTGPGADS